MGIGFEAPGFGTFEPDFIKRLAVWNKATPILGQHPALCRQDVFGNRIEFLEYGNRCSAFGWEFDHYPLPSSLGGTDDVSNLRPLHWRANASHGGVLQALLNL